MTLQGRQRERFSDHRVRPANVACRYAVALPLLAMLLSFAAWRALAQEPQPPPSRFSELFEPATDAETLQNVLATDRKLSGARSVGSTSTGELLNGVLLDRGAAVAVLPTHTHKNASYGAENLAQILDDAAAKVAEAYPGSVVYIGDGSSQDGGSGRGHKSHRCGRDVDVAFFTTNADGAPTELGKFARFDAEGKCCDGATRFDEARNWALVRALLEHPSQEVQYIFVYDPLRVKLLEYAAAHGASELLLEQASKTLRQPSDSAIHDDHFHLRVLCSARDRVEGCLNRGPIWSWSQAHDDALSRRADLLLSGIDFEKAAQTEQSLELLKATEATMASADLAALLPYASDDQQHLLLQTLETTGVIPAAAAPLAAALERIENVRHRRRLVSLLGRTDNPQAVVSLSTLAARSPKEEAQVAVRALVNIRRADSVAALLPALARQDAEELELDKALSELTNHTSDDWPAWLSEHRGESLETWMVDGFHQAGLSITSLEDASAVPALIALVGSDTEYLSNNAHRALGQILDHWMAASPPPAERQDAWKKWWRKNSWRYE
ncbi:MAG: hypothetical protein CO108_04595 [Deltaproteobacteria bacterium CG_4_9_14_3_um_filter_63_12]|nr:MAG: hypothetical protein CO108_04595 [Deltaproteobacteria bacterium CG_4_9_14_3_um_filter_63_12]